VALSPSSPLSHVLPCFPILILSSTYLVIFKHPYLTHTTSDFRNLKCYGFSTSFSSHPPFRFPLEEKNLQTLRTFYGVTSFSRYPLVEKNSMKIKMHLLLLRPWTLNLDDTIFLFLYFGILLAYPSNFY
jgi:hypothetical protein